MTSAKLSQIGELSLLEQIRKKFSGKSRDILVGIGDDAAAVKPMGKTMLLTTDMMVENIHFDLRFTTPYQIGFKLVSINVSDIYAMGGKPLYFLLNVTARRATTLGFVDMFFSGVKEALTLYDTMLIGGDLSATDTSIYISATLIGYTDRCVKRSGANVGDRIYVTGNLGDSACGLELLKKIKKPIALKPMQDSIMNKVSTTRPSPSRMKGKRDGVRSGSDLRTICSELTLSTNTVEPLIRKHLLPIARTSERFVRHATSMIDISDGLLIDLTRLCNESNVGARIYLDTIPVSPEMRKVAEYLGISHRRLALSGGEDYEMLFTAPAGRKVRAIHIGDIVKSGRLLIDESGREKPFPADGYQHFGKRRKDQ